MGCGHPQLKMRMASSGNQLEIQTTEKLSHKINIPPFKMGFHTMETVWWFLKRLNIELPCGPVILLLCILPTGLKASHLYTEVHSSIIHSNQKVKTTQMFVS